ncbi:MAG: nucleotidyltransferase domain-containing protein [Planctomycetes bacterium]|nr:nucleotidyltransferase domain-containing protein [Planctomycetota bacterium]
MVDARTIGRAVGILRRASRPRRIVLFGSYARGRPTGESDLDFLVVKRRVRNTMAEMVRLRRLLSPLRIPADVLVVSERRYTEWSDTPGNVLHSAATEGKVLYEAP